MSLVDLLDLPFNVIHLLYKNALLTAIAQREKEEAERKQKEEEEKRAKAQEAKERKMNAQQRGPIQSAIPVKQNQPVQMPSPTSSADASRLGDASMTELEDMFEEGL